MVISGNIALIRDVIYHLYCSISASGILPFPSIPKNTVEHRLSFMLQNLSTSFSESEQSQLTYRFAVYLIHYQQKTFFSKTPYFMKYAFSQHILCTYSTTESTRVGQKSNFE